MPAAGLGTRFLPATKTVPKELLPVVETPGIEMIAEEAAFAGAKRMVIITSGRKREVLRHFDEFPDLVEILRARGKVEQAEKVERAAQIIHPVAVTQEKPLGLGHAVGLAEGALEDRIRHDLGNPAGFIPASVEFGLRHPKYGAALFHDLEAIMEKYRPELG